MPMTTQWVQGFVPVRTHPHSTLARGISDAVLKPCVQELGENGSTQPANMFRSANAHTDAQKFVLVDANEARRKYTGHWWMYLRY